MSDKIVRAISADGMIKAEAVDTRNIVEKARKYHGLSPLACAALGRTLSIASIMGSDLKNVNGSVTLQIRGNGPLGHILAVGEYNGNVRGTIQNPGADLPLRSDHKLDVGKGVGQGTLTVVRDLKMKEPYVGTIELLGGEIAEDIAAYYTESEQIPTACALGVLVNTDRTIKASGGYLIQLMPGASEEAAEKLEKRVLELGPITSLLDQGMDAWTILQNLMEGFDPQLLEEHEIDYQCNCSRERVERAMISLGKQELIDMAEEREETEVACQFCDKKYIFTSKDLKNLIKECRK